MTDIEKSISFKYHYDMIPDHETHHRDRLQCFIIFQNRNEETLSGNTIFIKESHKHLELFNSYMRCLSSKFKAYTCPTVMAGLRLDQFNDRLEQLHDYVNGTTDEVEPFVVDWAGIVKKKVVKDAPKQFELLVSNYLNGDVVIFECGTIHAVLGEKNSNIIRTKVYVDIYGHSSDIPDNSGFACSAGEYKQKARKYELQHMAQRLNLTLPEGSEQFFLTTLPHHIQYSQVPSYPNVDPQEVADQLQSEGVIILPELLANNQAFIPICQYLHRLMGLPDTVSLSDIETCRVIYDRKLQKRFGVTNDQLRRTHSAKDSHVPTSSGITGYGVYCPEIIESAASLSELLKKVYACLDMGNPVCTAVDCSYQIL